MPDRRRRFGHSPFLTSLTVAVAPLTGCGGAPVPPPPPSTWSLAVVARVEVHARPWELAVHDVDGDGDPDVVVGGGGVTVLLNEGGALTPAPGGPFTDLVQAIDFAFGDFDGDGRDDVVVADHDAPSARFSLLLAQPDGSYTPAPGSPFPVEATPHLHTVAAVDADADGALDVVTDSWPENRLVLVRGRGDGTFRGTGEPFDVPPAPMQNLRAADLDGNGTPDVVTPAHDSDGVTVLLGDGDGGFRQAPGSPFAAMGGFTTVELVDVDLDGDRDIVAVHRSDMSTRFREDGLSVLLNDGSARFAHAAASPVRGLPLRSNDLAIGDLDGDGQPEVVVLGETHRELALVRPFREDAAVADRLVTEADVRGVAVCDLDGDGRCEVLVSDFDAGVVRVMR